jgi:hypothetical protein
MTMKAPISTARKRLIQNAAPILHPTRYAERKASGARCFERVACKRLLGNCRLRFFSDELIHKLRVSDDALVSFEPRHFHLTILENVHLDSLPNERDRNQDRIRAMPLQRKVDARTL